MPIDPRIPLGADIGPQVDPFKAFDYALRMRQAKRLEEQDAQEAQYRQQVLQERQQVLAQQAQEREQKQQATQEFNTTLQRAFESGEPSSLAVQQELIKSGHADLFMQIEPHLRGFDEARKKIQDAKLDAAKNIAATIHRFGNTPEALEQSLPFFKAAGWTDQELAPYLQRAQEDPGSIAFMTRTLAGDKIKEEPQERNPTEASLAFQAEGTGPEAEQAGRAFERLNKQKATTERNPTEASLALAAAQGDPAAQKAFGMLNPPKPAGEKPAKPPTENEKKTLGFYQRAQSAVDNLSALEPAIAKSGFLQQERMNRLPDFALSTEQKLYKQAQRTFIEAKLRRESGAAIAPSEYENEARTFFAQPGENATTIEQKRKARQVVVEGLRYSSGKAYADYYGEEAPKAVPAGGASGGAQLKVGAVKTFPNGNRARWDGQRWELLK